MIPDISQRMKIKDVFYHPWVISYEKEFADQDNKRNSVDQRDRSKLDRSSIDDSHENSRSYKLKEFEIEFKKIKENENIQVNKQKVNPEVKSSKNSVNGDALEKIKENLNSHKKSSIKIAMDSSDFQLDSNEVGDNIFDKVLNQVMEKNKGPSKGRIYLLR